MRYIVLLFVLCLTPFCSGFGLVDPMPKFMTDSFWLNTNIILGQVDTILIDPNGHNDSVAFRVIKNISGRYGGNIVKLARGKIWDTGFHNYLRYSMKDLSANYRKYIPFAKGLKIILYQTKELVFSDRLLKDSDTAIYFPRIYKTLDLVNGDVSISNKINLIEDSDVFIAEYAIKKIASMNEPPPVRLLSTKLKSVIADKERPFLIRNQAYVLLTKTEGVVKVETDGHYSWLIGELNEQERILKKKCMQDNAYRLNQRETEDAHGVIDTLVTVYGPIKRLDIVAKFKKILADKSAQVAFKGILLLGLGSVELFPGDINSPIAEQIIKIHFECLGDKSLGSQAAYQLNDFSGRIADVTAREKYCERIKNEIIKKSKSEK